MLFVMSKMYRMIYVYCIAVNICFTNFADELPLLVILPLLDILNILGAT